MVTKSKLDVDALVKEDRVHSSVYTDPDIFDLEMERIYYRTWVYVAHENEVAKGGDYKTAYIGLQPVIVSRNADDGEIYVMYNRCRHRGALVCQAEYGNANFFRCEYHGWTYNNKGDLTGVTYKQGYGSGFDPEEYGLVRVPRVGNYRGFIFASLSEDGPTLEEHLGNARGCFDFFADQGPEGIEVGSGAHKDRYRGNWKFQLENIVDHYHFDFTHRSVVDLGVRRAQLAGRDSSRGEGYRWCQDLGNGHVVNGFEEEREAGIYYGVGGFKISSLPNLMLIGTQIRVIRPISVDETEIWRYPVALKGVPEEVNEKRLVSYVESYGPSGFISPDDLEMFGRLQRGLQATRGNPWVLFMRGLENEETDERGIITSPASLKTETPQRGLFRQWKQLIVD